MPTVSELEERRFDGYLEQLSHAVGHEDRRDPLRAYLVGLCLPGERKSIEPIAARVDPRHVSARHQSLHHFVALAPWDDRALLRITDRAVLEQMDRHGGVMAWSVDDTGIPKKGTYSVGVARQYCGNLGKQDNCQVAVSISFVNEAVSIPAAYRLYLPEEWARDRARRTKAGVPEETPFRTQWQLALEQIDVLRAEGLPEAPIVADAGYGTAVEFREGLTDRGMPYVVGIQSTATLWPPGKAPLPPAARKRDRRGGRPPTLLRRDAKHRPLDALTLARNLPKEAWEPVAWREGTKGLLSSRFARVAVRVAHRDYNRRSLRPAEWLLIEWPEGEAAPTKYWLSTLPADTPMEMLVRWAKVRWRIERDYEELKQEFGLDQFEGRGWRGFHHHATLCIAAYGFLAAERARLSPPRPLAFLHATRVPTGFHPRGAPTPS